ncbi:hypothetical protein [Pseudomonas anguilliseptica]|uniref:hypothetical protein n=1 Tax=Pseudomonas anguilliseptica TaxID=53406 RepID=UPI00325B0502
MLPRHVQDQADAAKALQDQLIQPGLTEENPADSAAPEQLQEQELPEQEPGAQPVVTDLQPETRDAAYWRHRFDVLQGKYNAEVPALRKEISSLTEKLTSAEQLPASAVQRAQDAVSDLTEAELENFGPDLISLIQRVAGKVAGSSDSGELREIKGELDQMREERQQDAAARFWTELESQVPNFREVNADPAFLTWLAETDPLSGQERQQLLVSAQQALDPYRVAAVFKAFGKPAKAPEKPTVPGDQVHPRQTKAVATDLQQQRIWSRAEISQFYREKASYSAEQAAAIETDIFAAQTQGRIR